MLLLWQQCPVSPSVSAILEFYLVAGLPVSSSAVTWRTPGLSTQKTCMIAFYLVSWGRLSPLLHMPVLLKRLWALCSAPLGYDTCHYMGLNWDIKWLLIVQNAAARVLTRTRKYDHISPGLQRLSETLNSIMLNSKFVYLQVIVSYLFELFSNILAIQMHSLNAKSLWIKASATCINVNVTQTVRENAL